MSNDPAPVAGSFRDPNGWVFAREGVIYRQINPSYREHYECLMHSGLYEALTRAGLLIRHAEVDASYALTQPAFQVIRPDPILFISYPYEWSFSQLKDSALTTLEIQTLALDKGMSLKDASAYNIQFHQGKPVLIDTLSFEKLQPGQPWVAYRQFCQHFLAPLALMAYRDARLGQLLRVHLDGIPLDLASKLLPRRTHFHLGLLSHIHLHAQAQQHLKNPTPRQTNPMGKTALLGLLDHLKSTVKGLKYRLVGSGWADYTSTSNYTPAALEHKQRIVGEMLDSLVPAPHVAWDLGANTGVFSRLASSRGIRTMAFDMDAGAVEKNYCECVARGEQNLLPLLMDLTNPSPGLGWAGGERMSMLERGPADVALALALVHHLAISNNLPLNRIARFFAQICRSLIIEFVPKSDPQTQKLLASRQDIFPTYDRDGFEREFNQFFEICRREPVIDTERVVYLMAKRENA